MSIHLPSDDPTRATLIAAGRYYSLAAIGPTHCLLQTPANVPCGEAKIVSDLGPDYERCRRVQLVRVLGCRGKRVTIKAVE